MRKLLFGFLFFASLPTLAQDWIRTSVKGDELLGTSDRVVLMFEDNGNLFQFNENDDKTYILKTSESFFDFTSIKGAKGRFTTNGIVGIYDNSDNLIEKLEIVYEVLEPATSCYPNKYTLMGGNNLKRSKKVIDYIKNGKGYIRFILPLHLTTNFDFKVPTLNQE